MSIYVERTFSTRDGNLVILQLMQPVRRNQRWQCTYNITLNDDVTSSFAAGYDSLDALLSAISKAKIYFENSEKFRNCGLFWTDEGDLGLSLFE